MNMMGTKAHIGFALSVLLIATSGSAFAQSVSRTSQDSKVTLEFYAPGTKANGATLSFNGKNYTRPLKVVEVTRTKWDRSTPEASYRGLRSASKSGDLDWILACYAPADRARVREVLSDPGARERHRNFHSKVVHSEINLRFDYGRYAILLVTDRQESGRTVMNEVPMKKTADGWLGTNDLKEDTFFVVMLEAVKDRLWPR